MWSSFCESDNVGPVSGAKYSSRRSVVEAAAEAAAYITELKLQANTSNKKINISPHSKNYKYLNLTQDNY